jgi:hypothetical protein
MNFGKSAGVVPACASSENIFKMDEEVSKDESGRGSRVGCEIPFLHCQTELASSVVGAKVISHPSLRGSDNITNMKIRIEKGIHRHLDAYYKKT